MFEKVESINPTKDKYIDNYAYTGIAKYFAIQARCAILNDWSKLLANDGKEL
jgi:hypothetical protein